MSVSSTMMIQALKKVETSKIKIANIVLDDNPVLALKYSIRDLPYAVVFDEGMVVVEARNLIELAAIITQYA